MRLFLSVAIAALLGPLGCSDSGGRESLGDKREWAILQAQYREKVPKEPEFTVVEGYELMALPSLDGKQRISIMLWPKSSPFYKQLPEGNYRLSKELWLTLLQQGKASSTVLEALRSHVDASPNLAVKRDAPTSGAPLTSSR